MKLIKQARRRHALRATRAAMIAMGRDPGDLLQPRNYRRFLKGMRQVAIATRRFGPSTEQAATAMREFGKAWRVAIDA